MNIKKWSFERVKASIGTAVSPPAEDLIEEGRVKLVLGAQGERGRGKGLTVPVEGETVSRGRRDVGTRDRGSLYIQLLRSMFLASFYRDRPWG